MDETRRKTSLLAAVIVNAIFWFLLLSISSLKVVFAQDEQLPYGGRMVGAPILSPIGMVIIIGALVGLAIIAIKKKK